MKIAKEQMLSLITFGYLFNLYMFSEQIKIESVLFLTEKVVVTHEK